MNRGSAWLEPGAVRMVGLVGDPRSGAMSAADRGVRQECHQQRVEEYLVQLRHLRSSFVAAVHIWPGQPGPGSEVTTLMYCDVEQLPKNVVIFDG